MLPPRRSRRTVAATLAGVARRVQSKPQQVHNTGVRPSRRAASNDVPVNTPYGARTHRGRLPVAVWITSMVRAKSSYTAEGPRRSRHR